MIYYVYFDSYGHVQGIASEKELAERHKGDPKSFLKACLKTKAGPDAGHETGHVGVMRFDNENELKSFLDSIGYEISGCSEGELNDRPDSS